MPTHERATGHIEVTEFAAQHTESEGRFEIAVHRIAEDFSGGLTGSGRSHLVLVTESSTGTIRFTGVERFTGSLGSRQGSFLFQNAGALEQEKLRSTWQIVPNSGTEDLHGIHGSGGCDASGYHLDYWFE